MELIKAIETRRSIRKYKDTPVSDEQIRELVRLANLAPSWTNSQVSRYYAVNGEPAREEFLNGCLPPFNRNNTANAGAFIVTTVVKGRSGYRSGGEPTHLGNGFQCFDNGLQVENLCLAATGMGLGTLIMGAYDEQAVRKFFAIPESEDIICVLSVGYPDIEPKTPERLSVDEILTIKK